MSTSVNNVKPKVQPVADQYVGIAQLQFGPINPNAMGIPQPIPQTNNGNTTLRGFSKFSALSRVPLLKRIINTQQNRL